MAAIFFLIKSILSICLFIIILRLWMQFTRVNYYNPFTQFIIKVTQPIIGPLRKLIPSVGRFDSATLLVLYVIALLKLIYTLTSISSAPYWDWQYLLWAFCVILHSLGNLIFWLLIIRSLLSWISRGQSGLEELLYQLTEPFIAPIRRIIPPIGNIDLSPMIFLFILIFLNMLAMSFFSPLWAILSI